MVNQRFLFNKAGLTAMLSCLGLVSTIKADNKQAQDSKAALSVMNSPECVASKNNIANFMRQTREGKPLVTLCPGSRALMEMLEAMLGVAEVLNRVQELTPVIQKKVAEASNDKDKSKLEADPDVKEYTELYAKSRKLSKQRDEIMEAALELFKSVIFGLNKNALILIQGAELISAEDAPDENHVLLDAQKLYRFCIMEAHARLTKATGTGKDEKNPPKTEEQGKSATQLQSGPAKKK